MVYCLTVSGHLNYNREGNVMSDRHYDEVAGLPYSEGVKCYLACQQELELLERLPDLQVEVAAVPTEPAVEEEIEERVLSAFEQETAAQEQPAQAEETAAEEPAAPVQDYPEGDPFSREETVSEPTRRINLNDLKFGRNYTTDGK